MSCQEICDLPTSEEPPQVPCWACLASFVMASTYNLEAAAAPKKKNLIVKNEKGEKTIWCIVSWKKKNFLTKREDGKNRDYISTDFISPQRNKLEIILKISLFLLIKIFPEDYGRKRILKF